ncbi:MAG: polysaccharide export protein [Deltaproteobacteria bacterium]|nr:polysaccharide export protein [Candidatus Zymogenaceae bacterium]
MKQNHLAYCVLIILFLLGTGCATAPTIPAYTLASTPKDTHNYQPTIKPGDEITITIWEPDEPTELELIVDRNGAIDVLFLEDIPVLGLTEREMDDLLTGILSEYYVDPIVMISIREMVYVMGQVNKPGAYDFENGVTLASILASAGGVTRDAKLKQVLVIRDYYVTPNIIMSNMSGFLKKGSLNENVILKSGDVVYVPATHISDIAYVADQIVTILKSAFYPAEAIGLTIIP